MCYCKTHYVLQMWVNCKFLLKKTLVSHNYESVLIVSKQQATVHTLFPYNCIQPEF